MGDVWKILVLFLKVARRPTDTSSLRDFRRLQSYHHGLLSLTCIICHRAIVTEVERECLEAP
jgi:hypothetical protein